MPQHKKPQLYRLMMLFIQKSTKAIAAGETPDLDKTFQLADALIKDAIRKDDLLECAVNYYDPKDLYVSHSANVAIFSLKMALGMGLSKEEVQYTVASALLHDVGFGKLLASIQSIQNYRKKGSSAEEEIDRARMHPQYASDAILYHSDRGNIIAEIILQHHERADGNGYPNQLPDFEQYLPAKIIAITDTYEALIHPRSHRDQLIPPVGISSILKQKGSAFSAELIKALIETLSIYPVGQYVRLNNGMIGKVSKTYPDNPIRPDIAVSVDGAGKRIVPDRIVKLVDERLLVVEECLPGYPEAR